MDLAFCIVTGRPEVAQSALLITNNGERELTYNIKVPDDTNLLFHPPAGTRVKSKAVERVLMEWQRPAGVDAWASVPPIDVVLITQFAKADQSVEEQAGSATTLKGKIINTELTTVEGPQELELQFGIAESIKLVKAEKKKEIIIPPPEPSPEEQNAGKKSEKQGTASKPAEQQGGSLQSPQQQGKTQKPPEQQGGSQKKEERAVEPKKEEPPPSEPAKDTEEKKKPAEGTEEKKGSEESRPPGEKSCNCLIWIIAVIVAFIVVLTLESGKKHPAKLKGARY